MGTWNTGVFENDIALDWVNGLDESHNLEFLSSALDVTRHKGYLDSDEAVIALAAAELVAALLGVPSSDLPEEARNWVESKKHLDARPLISKAVRTIAEVLSPNSELRELWEENPELLAAWLAKIESLLVRLD